jgi:hypothetical protein
MICIIKNALPDVDTSDIAPFIFTRNIMIKGLTALVLIYPIYKRKSY